MTKHLRYGGSTAKRTINCPVWHSLADELPKLVEVSGNNPAAEEGTLLHNCMESIYDLDKEPSEILKAKPKYLSAELDKEMYDYKLIPAFEATEDLLDKWDIADIECEPFVTMREDIGGSIDLIGLSVDRKTLLVLDYKFGYYQIDPEENEQLLFYAVNSSQTETLASMFTHVEKIVLAVVQPVDGECEAKEWVTTMDTLDNFETAYLNAVEIADNPEGAAPNTGEWCKYCPVEATCPAKTGEALKLSRLSEIQADKIAEYLPMAEGIESWIKAVRKLAHEQLELGTPINGYKLVNKRGKRVWNDETAVEAKVRKAKKIKLADGFDYKLKSVAQLEKVCAELGVDFGVYSEYISSVSSGTTIAKESDKRPAALPIQGLAQLNAMND